MQSWLRPEPRRGRRRSPRGVARRNTGRTVVAALVFAAFAPGQIYSYGVFPMSLLTLSLVGFFWLLSRGRWLAAGAVGGVAVLAHPVALLLVPVSAAWLLMERGAPLRERIARTAITCGFIAMFTAVVVETAFLYGSLV